MTTTYNQTMSTIKIEGTPAHIRKFLRHTTGRVNKLIRGTGSTVYIAVPSRELGWIDTCARDTGVKKIEVPEFPKHGTAPCGIFAVNVAKHRASCKKCIQLNPSKSQDGECVTVVKVKGLKEFNVTGLADVMRQHMDKALNLAQEYDTALKALEKIPALQEQLEEIEKALEEHRQALKYFSTHKV